MENYVTIPIMLSMLNAHSSAIYQYMYNDILSSFRRRACALSYHVIKKFGFGGKFAPEVEYYNLQFM